MKELTSDYIFDTTAVFEKGCYSSFGIHPKLASMYGYSPEDIVYLKMKVSENQERLSFEENKKHIDYWGWFEFEDDAFSDCLLWPNYLLLNMCFPYGIKAAEDCNRGKAYRLEVV